MEVLPREVEVLTRTAVMMTTLTALVAACAGPTAMSAGDPSAVDERPHADCPLGSGSALPAVPWQDRPAMYEPGTLPAAMDTRAGRIVVLQPRPTVVERHVTWTFDVCRNSWQRMAATLAPEADLTRLVYHAAADLTLAIPGWEGPVRAYSAADDTWTDIPSQGQQPNGISDAVYDPESTSVIGWNDWASTLWTYDLGSGTWAVVTPRAGDPWPDTTSTAVDDWTGYTLMTYDTVRHAVLLAVFAVDGRGGSTWAFDVASRRWTDLRSSPPALLLNYLETGTEMVYDSEHGRAVAISGGEVAVFDSSTGTWSRSSPDAWGDILEFDTTWPPGTVAGSPFLPDGLPIGLIARYGHTVVYDPANERVVMLGGSARMIDDEMPADLQLGWWLTADTWAYDVGDNTWTQLVPEQEPLVMTGTYRPSGRGTPR